MKVGDIIHYCNDKEDWGIVVKEDKRTFQVIWRDGELSWVIKAAVALLGVK
jgi:hypothetical protein